MNTTIIQKQFVVDEKGNHIGVILPMADYFLVEPLLRRQAQKHESAKEHRMKRLQQAAAIMREEYAHDKELTVFTALDGEEVVE